MANSAFAAAERSFLAEPDRCPDHRTPLSHWGFCEACEDELEKEGSNL